MQHLYNMADLYKAEIEQTEFAIDVRLNGRYSFKTFEGVDRYFLAAQYIVENK